MMGKENNLAFISSSTLPIFPQPAEDFSAQVPIENDFLKSSYIVPGKSKTPAFLTRSSQKSSMSPFSSFGKSHRASLRTYPGEK